jgi:hypothetical protein
MRLLHQALNIALEGQADGKAQIDPDGLERVE